MKRIEQIEDCIKEALWTIQNFITEVTGQEPTQQEIADSLVRYFVLNEIREHVEMDREPEE